jgi:hypothetical protein
MSRKRHKFDIERTANAGFLDKRSYWTVHGKVFLFGADKSARREEIYRRDQGTCCYCGCLAGWNSFSGWDAGEWHHDPPLSKGGDDSLEGGKWTCKPCHRREDGRQVRWTQRGAA